MTFGLPLSLLTGHPKWDDEVFELFVADTPEKFDEMISCGSIDIRVMDDDGFFDKDDFLGHVKLDGDVLRDAIRHKGDQTFPLLPDTSRSSAYNKHVNENVDQADLIVVFEVSTRLRS